MHVRSVAVFQPQPPSWGAFRQLLSSAVGMEPVIPTHWGAHQKGSLWSANLYYAVWILPGICQSEDPLPSFLPQRCWTSPNQPTLVTYFTAVPTVYLLRDISQQVWWKHTMRSWVTLLHLKLCCLICFGCLDSNGKVTQFPYLSVSSLKSNY